MAVHFSAKPAKTVLLTLDDVTAWQNQAAALKGKVIELQGQIEAIEAKLAAAALFMGDSGIAASANATDPAASTAPTRPRFQLARPMTALVRELFDEGVRLTPAEVVRELSKDPKVAERLRDNVNNVYTALGRLTNRDKILIRHDDGSYSLLSEANEPPSGDSAGGSEAGEGSYPSLNFNPQPTHPG